MSYSAPPPPPPGGGYGQPAPYGGGMAPQGNNQKALWSLILGIVGILCCGVFTGIPAMILSKSAEKEIAQTGQQGAGMAKAGFILGIVSIALFVLAIILYATGALTFNASVN